MRLKRSKKKLFQKLVFYNTFDEKPKIKRLKNIDLLQELPFHDEPNVYEMSK